MTEAEAHRAAARFLMIGFDGPVLPNAARDLLAHGVFGAILFSRNYVDRGQVAELCRSIKGCAAHPIAIAVDHEGGRVQRFRGPGFSETQPMRDLGKHPGGAEERARAIGRLIASELRPLGIDIDFAPVLDVDSNPKNPVIGERSFSHDPEIVARLGCALIDGLQSGGVAACGKHFPGHGDTDQDSHLDLPRLPHDLARLRSIELVPFAAAAKAGVASVMTSHIIFESLDRTRPATMSPPVLALLRDELRFRGVVVSDDLEMKAIADHYDVPQAAIDSVNAGCDLLLCCHTASLQTTILRALTKAIRDGVVPASRVADAEARRSQLLSRYVR